MNVNPAESNFLYHTDRDGYLGNVGHNHRIYRMYFWRIMELTPASTTPVKSMCCINASAAVIYIPEVSEEG